MTVGGDRETHWEQELLVYHQGVCQGAGTCRQGLARTKVSPWCIRTSHVWFAPVTLHEKCMKIDIHVCIKTFLKPWPDLMWLVLKVVLLPCSVSACEHSWSIQGWIHPKRRNRLGQDLVECLVRTHTNLQVKHRLEIYETGMLPWELEMTVEEPF